MAAQTFRHAAQLSASGHRLLDRIRAMLALLYNAALEERIQAYCRSGKSISLYDQYKSLTEIRQDHADWRAISVLVVRSALALLDRAMKAFFARAQSGAEPGFPRFRARSRYRSFSIEDPKAARSAIRILDGGQRGELRMKGLPRMRFAIRRALPPMDRLRSFHVVRKARRVEVQLVFERPLPEVRTGVPERPVGLDVGIRTFAMLSDGESLQRRPRQGVRSAIRRKQRAVSRSRRGSKSRGKKQAALARAHERMAEAGRQELHRHADWIVRTYDFIAVEALKIGNMLRRGPGKRGLNRAISEQGWREFFDILKCKAESAGIPFVEVPPAGTSQECSRCGTKVPKALSERTHQCDVCGLELDRDENAARNVLCRGLRIFAGTAAAGGTAQGAPAASAARYMQE